MYLLLFLTTLGLPCCVGAFLPLWRSGTTLQWWCFSSHRLLLLWSPGSSACRLQYLWPTDLVAPWHVRSSRTRDQTHVPCISRQILNHWTTREVPKILFTLLEPLIFFFKRLREIWTFYSNTFTSQFSQFDLNGHEIASDLFFKVIKTSFVSSSSAKRLLVYNFTFLT